ncbi:Integrase catalytic domain-containing protein [Aphis craccivora]|uniref:Integrase catalytic domain-containing protein n=1 Tax=Aphis craccivora TaxID=307492 RepID=A0A6G0WH71_APHCR|nr:Integrase catalytic domain-containing protein [Aphis craccivora]
MLRAEAVDGSQRTEPYSRMGRTREQKRVFRRESKWKYEETRAQVPCERASPKDSPQATNR